MKRKRPHEFREVVSPCYDCQRMTGKVMDTSVQADRHVFNLHKGGTVSMICSKCNQEEHGMRVVTLFLTGHHG